MHAQPLLRYAMRSEKAWCVMVCSEDHASGTLHRVLPVTAPARRV